MLMGCADITNIYILNKKESLTGPPSILPEKWKEMDTDGETDILTAWVIVLDFR